MYTLSSSPSFSPSSIHFLPIPMKKGSEVDLIKPTISFITESGNYGNPVDYHSGMSEIQNLRNRCINQTKQFNENLLKDYQNYADQITSLDLKLPLNESQIRIKFKWQDSLVGTKGKITYIILASGAYEKACVLFNLAAISAGMAEKQNMQDDEGLKKAAKLFQQASGIFTYLQKASPIIFLSSEPPRDLRTDVLGIFASITLAQAQDIFLNKAQKGYNFSTNYFFGYLINNYLYEDLMKSSLLAKLSQQCSQLYDETAKQIDNNAIKALFSKDWSIICLMKKSVFQALAYFHEAKACQEKKEHPQAIARFKQARETIQKTSAAIPIKPFPYQDLQKTIESEAGKAERENSLIFHTAVPDPSKLSQIEKAVLAKPTPVENVKFCPGTPDMLDRLMPLSVQQASAKCEERRIHLVQGEISKLREATRNLNNFLATLNLPAALEDLDTSELPKSLKEKSERVRGRGGFEKIERLVSDLPGMLTKCKGILDNCEKMLLDEEMRDKKMRSSYQGYWSRTPSEILNKPIKEEIRQYKVVVQEALKADSLVKQKYSTHKNSIILLSENIADIERSLPPNNPTLSTLANQKFVKDLKELVRQVEELKEERTKLEETFKNATIDASTKYLASFKKEGVIYEETISREEMERVFGPLRERASKSLAVQERISKQIQIANNELEKMKASKGGSSKEREQRLRQLATAYDVYMDLSGTTEEGNKFYRDFTKLLEKYQTKINNFVAERRKEIEDLMREIPTSPLQPTPQHHQQQNLFSTHMLYNALPNSKVVVGHQNLQNQPSAFLITGPNQQGIINPYATFLPR